MAMDQITEAIAHFIGLFSASTEEARLKKAFDEFQAQHASHAQTPDHPTTPIVVNAPYDLDEFDPHVPYLALPTEITQVAASSHVAFTRPEIAVPHHPNMGHHGAIPHHASTSSGQIVLPHIEPPGSVAVYINQEIQLSDNDYVSVGAHGLSFTPDSADTGQMTALLDAAAELSPIDDLQMPGNAADIASFVMTAHAQLDAFADGADGATDVFVVKAETIQGTYVNGVLVEDAPKLEDHLDYLKDQKDASDDPDAETPAPAEHASVHGGIDFTGSVELDTGSNTLINSAVLTNNWTSSGVMAVAGNHIELNAIVQINAYCDSDQLSTAINGWAHGAGDANEAFNIALFQRTDPSAAGDDDPGGSDAVGGFPPYWVVTQVTGDLIMTNWIQQYTFMTDNDTCIVSSSGTKSVVTTGDNTAINGVSLNELGYYYDLIIVGGNVYDANIIHQMNVLVDNDMIGAVDGFQTTGQGSYASSGNMLWNEAAIYNYGKAGSYQPMTSDYQKAIDNLAAGKQDIPSGVLHDDAFAGIGVLRVLYVSGDILNLQYVSQTNILGDSDQVALAMDQYLAHPDANWTITTGNNQLVNYAGIVDNDGTIKTYVGGEHYSDEVLIQANIISSEPDLGSQDPNALVNEAVAFLGDDTIGDSYAHHPDHVVPLMPDTATADGVQHMLA